MRENPTLGRQRFSEKMKPDAPTTCAQSSEGVTCFSFLSNKKKKKVDAARNRSRVPFSEITDPISLELFNRVIQKIAVSHSLIFLAIDYLQPTHTHKEHTQHTHTPPLSILCSELVATAGEGDDNCTATSCHLIVRDDSPLPSPPLLLPHRKCREGRK